MKFNWLHLTDLHFGLIGQRSLWPNLRHVFFEDLSRLHDKCGPWDAVFFTGDMVQSGEKSQFAQINDQVIGPLWEKLSFLGSQGAVFLAVPGNHDLQRPDNKRPSAALRQMLRQGGFAEIAEEFWESSESEYRKIITDAFAGYSKWSKGSWHAGGPQIREGALPGDFVTTIQINGDEQKVIRIGVAGINTTFLQLAAGDFAGRLNIDPKQLHEACGGDLPSWCGGHDACILMTHQGPQWLTEECREIIYPEINPAGRFAAHIFGHMHETVLRSTSYGGGKTIRQWQGRSIFGMDKFGEPPSIERRHGYSIGQIDFGDKDITIRQWPRKAVRDQNGWRFERDHDNCVLIENDGGTAVEPIASLWEEGSNSALVKLSSTKAMVHKRFLQATTEAPSLLPYRPHEDQRFVEYCQAVCKAHSHIRFVEIPHLKDISDVEMDSLYVEPRLSAKEIHPDILPKNWPECIEALSALTRDRQLVLLGDPGSGKSTLVSCIAWQLCRPASKDPNKWRDKLGHIIPMPMILRELRLKADLTWEGLMDAFLEHRIGKLLHNRKNMEALLSTGRAFVLMDGLDEVGNLKIRRKLKEAIHAGMAANPDSRWLLTSRVVGYDSVPFDYKITEAHEGIVLGAEVLKGSKGPKRVRIQMTEKLFLAPFNDGQIAQFATNWYTQHEREGELVQQSAADFVGAIKENEGTQRLARIPYLLTLMALIHHKNARLPHGRTELYERIATAYLESIDLRRQLDQLPYSLSQKKRWLAEVAYRMQLRRAKVAAGGSQGEILASKSEVEAWLKKAMTESAASESAEDAAVLLDYFAKRSGLLLPRGEGKFAFMHLSLQEYFAACFLEPRLTASRFVPWHNNPIPSDEKLRSWANDPTWREAFVLLFELLSEKSILETEAFLAHLFTKRLDLDRDGVEATAAGLLAELATDPFVRLTVDTRRMCRQEAWRWSFRQKTNDLFGFNVSPSTNTVVRTLLRESKGDLNFAWKSAAIGKEELAEVMGLDFASCAELVDINPLTCLKKITHLSLRDCSSVTDLTPLALLKNLRMLELEACGGISSLCGVLDKLNKVKLLFVSERIDFGAVAKMKQLRELHVHLDDEADLDITPLAGMKNLKELCLGERTNRFRISRHLLDDPMKILSPGVRLLVMDRGEPVEEVDSMSESD